MKKYQIEKVFHEIIRDIPDANKYNEAFEKGLITAPECMEMIMKAYRKAIEPEKRSV